MGLVEYVIRKELRLPRDTVMKRYRRFVYIEGDGRLAVYRWFGMPAGKFPDGTAHVKKVFLNIAVLPRGYIPFVKAKLTDERVSEVIKEIKSLHDRGVSHNNIGPDSVITGREVVLIEPRETDVDTLGDVADLMALAALKMDVSYVVDIFLRHYDVKTVRGACLRVHMGIGRNRFFLVDGDKIEDFGESAKRLEKY